MLKTLVIVSAIIGTLYADYYQHIISLDSLEVCRSDWQKYIACRTNRGIYDIQQQNNKIITNHGSLQTKLDEITSLVNALIKLINK